MAAVYWEVNSDSFTREEGEGVWNGMKENSLTDERF
jgi:hypothetical protein